jgi:hypothetical protein
MPDAGASRKRQIRGWGIREPFYDSRQLLHSRPGFPNPCFGLKSGVAAPDLSGAANAPPHSACPARGFIARGIRFPAAGRLGAVRVSHPVPIVRCNRAERLASDSIHGLEVWRSAVVFRRTGTPCLQHKGFHDHATRRAKLVTAQACRGVSSPESGWPGSIRQRVEPVKVKSRRVGRPRDGRRLKWSELKTM